ncbi:MAG TPA: lysylphosphatidylglycerol synthase transmembrane domain-containing protein [Xanthobacteraceae bacterium]|jgi:glycosyltransferase 2 family protein|nr:lysylphosphatidylglycerol synthase transmembrane domain-containing protein [Xanthobacteraceae bacterium]
MKRAGSSLLFSFVKAAITVSLIAWICSKIDFSLLARHLQGGGVVYLALGTLLLALNDTVVATRWYLILRRLNVKAVSLAYIVASTYAGVFIGQAAPGPIGADAVRGWMCHRRGVPLRTIVMSLVTDRVLALLGYLAVAMTAGYWQVEVVGASIGRHLAVLAAVAAAAAVTVLWLMPALTGALAKRWRRFHAAHDLLAMFRFTALSGAGALGMALSCVVVAITVNAVMLLSRGFGFGLAPSVAYLVVPIAILFAALPISIGGWGVREASLSYGLTLFGTPPHDAALVALALGIGFLLASLPGGIAVLALGGKVRPPLPGGSGKAAAPQKDSGPAGGLPSREQASPRQSR